MFDESYGHIHKSLCLDTTTVLGPRFPDVPLPLGRQLEQLDGILGRPGGRVFNPLGAHVSQDLQGIDDITGFASLAAQRHRRQVGRIGFDQQTVSGDDGGGFTEEVIGLEGQGAVEAEMPAQVEKSPGIVCRTDEAVDDAAIARMAGENGEGVSGGITGVDDDRQIGLRSELELGFKLVDLQCVIVERVVVFQSDFAKCFGSIRCAGSGFQQGAQSRQVIGKITARLMAGEGI